MPTASDLLAKATRVLRAADHAVAKPHVRLAYFAVIALIATWPLLSTGASLNVFRDAQVLGHYEDAARRSVVTYHETPLWDPWYCGGMYLLGTPQSRFVSPTFLLSLVFGTSRGEALAAFFMMLVGLEGVFRYARARGGSALGAALAAPVFALSGTFATAPLRGWTNFFGYELVPWAGLGAFKAARGSRIGAGICAVSAAWIVGMGGTYAGPMTAMWCAFEVIDAIASAGKDRKRIATALGMAAVTALLTLSAAMIRVWPVGETLLAAPRIIGGTPGQKYSSLATSLFGILDAADGDYKGTAGAFFIGALAGPAIAAGALRRRSTALIVFASMLFWMSAGFAVKPSLFAWLRALPLFEVLRYPERYLTLFGLAAAGLASMGVGYTQVLARRKNKLAVIALLVVAGGLFGDVGLLIYNMRAGANGRWLESPAVERDIPFRQARGDRWSLSQYAPMNQGSLSCWDAYPVPQSAKLRGDLPAEEYAKVARSAKVTRTSWTPNRITLDVEAATDATILVNQNWHPGWRATGGAVKSEEGLLAVDVPAGKHEVVLEFAPRSAKGGALASFGALAMVVAFALRSRRRGDGDVARGAKEMITLAVAAALPLAAAAVYGALSHEPAAPRVGMATPAGEPVIVDAPVRGAREINVKFAAETTLVAVRLTSPSGVTARPGENSVVPFVRPGDELALDLDWETTGSVPRGLGVFVHIDPEDGDSIRGDHAFISGVLDLEDAPHGKILRDVLPITIHDSLAGKRCEVWVGLWGLRGNGQRVRVEDAGSARVTENRVYVGTFQVAGPAPHP